MANAQESKDVVRKPGDDIRETDELAREIKRFKLDFDAEADALKAQDDAEVICEKLSLLQNFCEDRKEKFEELIQKRRRGEELAEQVGKCCACLGAWTPNDPKLLDVVFDLKQLDAIRNGEIEQAFVGLPALFVLLRQPSDVELDYELVSKSDKRFAATKRGIDDVVLRWECDFGGSEGIYIDLYLDYYDADNKKSRADFATIKTLKDDDDSFREMCALGCEYAIAFKNLEFRKR